MKSKEESKERWPVIYPPIRHSMFFNCRGDCVYYEDGKVVGIQLKSGKYIDKTKAEVELEIK
jgi:hypothetical protein